MKVIDMHCDTIMKLYQAKKEGRPYTLRDSDGQLSLTGMKQGDYLLQNFAMFVYMNGSMDPYQTCHEMMDVFDEQMAANADLILPVRNSAEIETAEKQGKMAALLTIEEGGVCQGSLAKLQEFYDRGARMMTLTWNFENEIGWPAAIAKDAVDKDAMGLKPFGIECVQQMEALGMIVDVSHLSDAGFYDVCKYTKAPFVASHSDARALCGHQRNLTDDMIHLLAERGGVTGLNYCGSFLRDEGCNPATLERIVAHAKHIANVGGIECLGLGSDFDGISNAVEMKDASGMQMLADALQKGGFTASETEKIFSKNVLRVYREVLK